MHEHLIGKTVASVTVKDMTGRDLHYKDQVFWTDTTVTFTDGTSVTFSESNTELDGDSIREAGADDDAEGED